MVNNHNIRALVTISLVSLCLLPFFLAGTFHDSQRLLSIIIINFLLFATILKRPTISIASLKFTLFLLVFGFLSSFMSLMPFWSFIEILLFLSIFLLSTLIFSEIDDSDIKFLVYLFSLIQTVYLLRFFLNYTFTILDGQSIDSYILIDGFSNIRFYAQFLSWVVPFVTAYLTLETKVKFHTLIIAITSIGWALAFFSGARAFILGIIASLIIVKLINPSLSARYFKKTFLMSFIGFFIYSLLAIFIPYLFNIDNTNTLSTTIDRDFTSSSGRIEIWLVTLQAALKYPYLGLGPMMTAAHETLPHVAHPHNFILQLAAEWGLIFTTIIVLAAGYNVWLWQKTIKQEPDVRASLAMPFTASISSAFCVSLVDGVMVMPVSLIYFCLIVGASTALLRSWLPDLKTIKISMLTSTILLISISLLSFIVTIQWLHLDDQTHKSSQSPRFWSNGKLQQDSHENLLDVLELVKSK